MGICIVLRNRQWFMTVRIQTVIREIPQLSRKIYSSNISIQGYEVEIKQPQIFKRYKHKRKGQNGNSHIPSPFFSGNNNFSIRTMASTFEIVSNCFLGRVGKLAKCLLLL